MRAIILAAGKGTRMKSDLPKVIHDVCGQPMVKYIVDILKSLDVKRIYMIVGHQSELIKENLDGESIIFVEQKDQLGTGHAVMQVLPYFSENDREGNCLVLSGDVPLITSETLKGLIETHIENNSAATVLTTNMPDPKGYGRIIRGQKGSVTKIVEEKDAAGDQLLINEINTGIYCFHFRELAEALTQTSNQNASQEYYLTDVIDILKKKGFSVSAAMAHNYREVLGINNRRDLAQIIKIIYERNATKHMLNGVTIIDPETTFIDSKVKIGPDTIIYPFSFIQGKTSIGAKCIIGPQTQIINSTIENNSEISNSEVKNSFIEDNVKANYSLIDNETVSTLTIIPPFTNLSKEQKIFSSLN